MPSFPMHICLAVFPRVTVKNVSTECQNAHDSYRLVVREILRDKRKKQKHLKVSALCIKFA